MVNEKKNSHTPVWGITALWAFSEAAFGGILHAFRIPFTGLFVGGAAAIFICLIAYFSQNKYEVIRSTVFVILIKLIISPHTPIIAHIAVFIEGVIGQLLFMTKRFYKTSAFFTGLFVLVYSAAQKLLFLTIVFGNTLWKSIDLFFEYILKQFMVNPKLINSISLSAILIITYSLLHIIAGVLVGIIGGKVPDWIQSEKLRINNEENQFQSFDRTTSFNIVNRKKKWWKKKFYIIIFSFIFIMLVLTYFNPQWGKNQFGEVLIMLVRAVSIIVVWFYFVSPLLTKYFTSKMKEKELSYTSELTLTIKTFPLLKSIVSYSWKLSKNEKGFKRIKLFLSRLFILLLTVETDV